MNLSRSKSWPDHFRPDHCSVSDARTIVIESDILPASSILRDDNANVNWPGLNEASMTPPSLFPPGLVMTDGAWGTEFQKRGLAIGEPADLGT